MALIGPLDLDFELPGCPSRDRLRGRHAHRHLAPCGVVLGGVHERGQRRHALQGDEASVVVAIALTLR